MKIKYKKSVLAAVLLVLTLIPVIFWGRKQTMAEKSAVDMIQDYLTEHNISFRSVTESGQIIMAELLSKGTGRCTLEDVKAVQVLNEALQCDKRLDEIRGLQVTVYDASGEKIYDICTARNQTGRGENATYHTMSEETMKAKAIALMENYSGEVKEIVYKELDSGISKLELEVEVAQEGIVSMLDLPVVDNELMIEFYNSGLSQFIASMKDENGKDFLYVVVDFMEKECNVWVSPEMEDDFIRLQGPAPALAE